MTLDPMTPDSDHHNPRVIQRHRRADATRRKALSPLRIITMVLALPLTTAAIAFGVYMRTSDFERTEALMHLIALAGCDAAHAVGLGKMHKGQPGYHARNDPDGNGVACESGGTAKPSFNAPRQSENTGSRMVGGAKFVRP